MFSHFNPSQTEQWFLRSKREGGVPDLNPLLVPCSRFAPRNIVHRRPHSSTQALRCSLPCMHGPFFFLEKNNNNLLIYSLVSYFIA